jgi:ligand-binding sensor domain-containing protein
MKVRGIWRYFGPDNAPFPHGVSVGDLVACPDGRVWAEVVKPTIANEDGIMVSSGRTYGIMMYDQKRWHSFRLEEMGLAQPIGTVGLSCGDAGHLWINLTTDARENLLYHFDGVGTTVFRSNEIGLPSDSLSWADLVSDSRRQLWAALGSMGAYFFDGARWQRFDGLDYLDEGAWVTQLALDHSGHLWFAVQKARSTSFVSYDSTKRRLRATAPVGYRKSAMQGLVRALAIDGTGRLWVGWEYPEGATPLGLWTLEAGSSEWVKYTSRNSALPEDQIRGIAFDGKGRAWVVTVGGLTIFEGPESVNWGAALPGMTHGPVSEEEGLLLMDDAISKAEPAQYVLIGGGVACDLHGRIWTGCGNGVGVFLEQ